MKTSPGRTSPDSKLMQGPAATSQELGARFSTLPRIAASRKRGVLEVSGIWPINNRPQATTLPRIAASRKRGVLEVSGIWPIDNRPQATSLPHNADPKIVAARDQTKM